MALSTDQALPLISLYESSNTNVPNASGPGGTAASTASGYYQIINGTWQQFAPKAGVDLTQYPTAMSAPKDVQTQVAGTIYAAQGFQPWASNTKLMTAVNSADPTTAAAAADTAPVAVGGTQNAGAAINGNSSIFGSIWEIALRGAVVFIGFGIVMIALAALLFQSKTVKVAASDLAAS